ncbi:MAG: AAA family ATPase [Candidatus Omnitrophica bacterium]|nr:AAA family ATPase [Candidatus Omnitrophota bacterium]
MYEQYWGFTKKPFENTPDPEFLYLSSQHEEALARLLYAIRERKGAAFLTGVFGCGKTVLGQALLRNLSEDRYRIAFINYPLLSHVEFLMAIAKSLGSHDLPTKKTEVLTNLVLDSLNSALLNNARDGKDSVIIIDEAHIIEDMQIFESLRLLLNFQVPERFLLSLILFGQPELRDKIELNKQFEQRIAIKCHLSNLDLKDTYAYINHRLKTAGRDQPLFTQEAIGYIYEHTGGIPRRINRLCDICLLSGFIKSLNQIDVPVILEEAKALGSKDINL